MSWYRSGTVKAIEFDIPEDAFLKWAATGVWRVGTVRPTEAMPVAFPRYHSFMTAERRAALGWPPISGPRSGMNTIKAGWVYMNIQANNGGVWLAYDQAEGRAYYYYSTH